MVKRLFFLSVTTLLLSWNFANAQYFTFVRLSDSIVYGASDTTLHSYYAVNNLTQSNISVHFSGTNIIVPPGWDTMGICTWNACYPSGYLNFNEVLPPGLHNTDLYVYFNAHQPGFSRCRITISYLTQSVSQYFSARVNPFGIRQISSVVKDFALNQNYPNPFNPNTKISFSIPKREAVYLRIYDILGREVKTLISEELSAGEYEYDFEAENMSSGFYYYSLRAGENVAVKKMVLVK